MAQQEKLGKTATKIKSLFCKSENENVTQVTYHDTVVTEFGSNYIMLSSGGWLTNTTKTRMNQASNQFNLGYKVFQKNFNWFVQYNNKIFPFYEHMELKR